MKININHLEDWEDDNTGNGFQKFKKKKPIDGKKLDKKKNKHKGNNSENNQLSYDK